MSIQDLIERMDTLIQSNKETNENISRLENRVEEIVSLKDVVDDHGKRIEALETKLEAVMNGQKKKRDTDEWKDTAEKENDRRNSIKKPKLVEIDRTVEKISSFAEALKKDLATGSNLADKVYHSEDIRYNRNRPVESTKCNEYIEIIDIIKESKKIIGLKPVTEDNMRYWREAANEKENPDHKAATEFLSHFLQLDTDEIDKLEMKTTKHSARSNILYVEMNKDGVSELYRK